MSPARRIEIALGILGLCATLAFAQAAGSGPPSGGPPQGGMGGQGMRGGRGGERSRPPFPLLLALDTDGDRRLSASEIANAPAALKTLDQNGDGKLSPDEYLPARPEAQGPGGEPGMGEPGAGGPESGGLAGSGGRKSAGGQGGMGGRGGGRHHPLVRALDTDGDGSISALEIASAPRALKALDADGDGQLSGEELHPARGEGQGAQGGAGRGASGEDRPEGAPPSASGAGAGRPWAPRSDAGGAAGASTEEVPWVNTTTAGGTSAPAAPAAGGSSPAPPPGEAASFSVTGVTSSSSPVRLLLSGEGFQPGCTIQVDGKAVPNTIYRSDRLAIAAGVGLDSLVPKGKAVHITVLNPDGGVSSGIAFTR